MGDANGQLVDCRATGHEADTHSVFSSFVTRRTIHGLACASNCPGSGGFGRRKFARRPPGVMFASTPSRMRPGTGSRSVECRRFPFTSRSASIQSHGESGLVSTSENPLRDLATSDILSLLGLANADTCRCSIRQANLGNFESELTKTRKCFVWRIAGLPSAALTNIEPKRRQLSSTNTDRRNYK